MKTWHQLAISVGLGIGIGALVGYLAKRHYENLLYEELDKADKDYEKARHILTEELDFACCEIFELREALRVMVDEMQYETILEQVKYKMREMDEKHPAHREYIEKIVAAKAECKSKERQVRIAVKIANDLGYSGTDEPIRTLSLKDEEELKRLDEERLRLVAKQNAFTEQALAEAEHPMDDGEEFEDGPRLAPNGDILDEGWDPSDEMNDEAETGTSYVLFVEGDTTIREEPYLITEHQFLYGKRDYSKCSVSYLSKDDTVLDEDDTELDQKYVGADNLNAFEETDCPSIFVRNDQLEIDYEIMWEDMSYTHDRLGYPESEVSGQRIWRKWDKED